MTVEIRPDRISTVVAPGRFLLPPDKSILHRLLIIGSMTRTAFKIPIRSSTSISHDIVATVLALESLGVDVELFDEHLELQGVGRHGFRAPNHVINCANSGTTARLLMGLLAGQTFNAALMGDESLSKRPMERLARLLGGLGARIHTAPGGTLPLMLNGSKLKGAPVALPVASAQMKSATLLAALLAEGPTVVEEPTQSRDHTERMLEAFGYGLYRQDGQIHLDPSIEHELPDELLFSIPGDISSAAFLAVSAALLHRDIIISDVLLNPTRTRFLDILAIAGIEFEATNITESWGEERGDLSIFGSRSEVLLPFEIEAIDVPQVIDELPVLCMLAAFADGESSIRGASELRLKESDRLHSVAAQLQDFGVEVAEMEDGLIIHGILNRRLGAVPINHHGDHRLTMAFSIAALFSAAPSVVEEAESVSVSYPEFYDQLAELTGHDSIRVYAE